MAAAGDFMASTMAISMIQPKMPETSTERTIPFGTLWLAWIVSSEACAEASNPVMVYAGSNSPSAGRANRRSRASVRNHVRLRGGAVCSSTGNSTVMTIARTVLREIAR